MAWRISFKSYRESMHVILQDNGQEKLSCNKLLLLLSLTSSVWIHVDIHRTRAEWLLENEWMLSHSYCVYVYGQKVNHYNWWFFVAHIT